MAGGLNLYGFANGDPVNATDPFGLCPPQDDEQHWWCHVLFVGIGGSAILGTGPTGGAGLILWSDEGPGIYIRAGGGFGGDVGAAWEGGHSTNMASFTGVGYGGCVSVNFGVQSAGGCITGNANGLTETGTYGDKAPVLPVNEHAELTYTKAYTFKGMLERLRSMAEEFRKKQDEKHHRDTP